MCAIMVDDSVAVTALQVKGAALRANKKYAKLKKARVVWDLLGIDDYHRIPVMLASHSSEGGR